jgi:excisionase family DNA binding protein
MMTTSPAIPELITTREAGAILKCGTRTIQNLVKRHNIQHYEIGGRLLICEEDFLRWVASREVRKASR